MHCPVRLICKVGCLASVLLFAWAGTAAALEILSPSDGDTFDVGEVITFSARAICPTSEISWTFGDGETAEGTTVEHSYGEADEYTVTASDPSGSDSITITIGPTNEPPTASASAIPTVAAVDQDIQFSSEGSSDPEGGALTYLWDFGDDSTSTDSSPSHSYDTGGKYTVTLTVTDPEDAEGTDTVDVTAVEVTFDTNPVMVGVSKTETVTATVTPSDAYGDVSFSTADATIATVSPAAASSNEQELTVTGVKMGTTTLQAEVGEYPCGSAAISVGQMVVVRITPDPGILLPGQRTTFTAVAFAAVKKEPLIPHDYSPDLSTPIGAEVTVGKAKGIYLGPHPVTWRLESSDAFIPDDVPSRGVPSVEVEARPWAAGDVKPELHCFGCNTDTAKAAVVNIMIDKTGNGKYQNIEKAGADVLPGQRVRLKLHVATAGLDLTGIKWTPPEGAFKDYSAEDAKGVLTPLRAYDVDKEELQFYWADAGEGRKMRCAFKLCGVDRAATVTLNVKAPTCVLERESVGVVRQDIFLFGRGPGFGLLPKLGEPGSGVSFKAEVTLPQGLGQGTWYFEQLVKPGRSKALRDHPKVTRYIDRQGQWVLDGHHRFPPEKGKDTWNTGATSQRAADSPNQTYDVDAKALTADDRFRTYVMFTPPGKDSRAVPLKVIEWSWHAEAEWDDEFKVWLFDPEAAKRTVPEKGTPTSAHPTWKINTVRPTWNNGPLTVRIVPDTVTEGAGVGAGMAKVSTVASVVGPLEVFLKSSRENEIEVEESILIPDGQTSKTSSFDVLNVDDVRKDPRVVRITARAAGYTTDYDTVVVVDDD